MEQQLPDQDLIDLGVVGRNLHLATKIRVGAENRLRNIERDGFAHQQILDRADQHVIEARKDEVEIEALLKDRAKEIPFVKTLTDQPGIGFVSAAKILAFGGDPLWHEREERLRLSGEWRAVCGVHTSKPGKYSKTTKAVLWNIADAVVKAGTRSACDFCDFVGSASEFEEHEHPRGDRRVPNPTAEPGMQELGASYLRYKEEYASAKHSENCARCGVLACAQSWGFGEGDCQETEEIMPGYRKPHKGHRNKKIPAGPGSPLTPGHIEGRARRLLMSHFCDLIYRLREEDLGQTFT